MRLLRGVLLVVLMASSAWGQQDFLAGGSLSRLGRKTHVRLVLSHETAKPGETVLAAFELTMDSGWHTYWQNPGDSGDATKINWTLPPGITAGEVQWPLPEKLIDPELGLTTYVFHNRAVLLVPLQIAPDAAPGTRDLSAKVSWVECEKTCVLGNSTVSAKLNIGNATTLSANTNVIAEAQKLIPSKQLPGSATAHWEPLDSTNTRPLVIEWTTDAASPDFYPITAGMLKFKGKIEVPAAIAGKITLRKIVELIEGDWPKQISGLLVRKEGTALRGYEVSLPIGEMKGNAAATTTIASTPGQNKSIWLWLGYAFLGGLILNIMPCVLPVIALKILGFVSQAKDHPHRVRKLGLIYALGVLVSFAGLAALVIGVKAAGHKAGWGMQFSDPKFIVGFTVLVTLVALNLFGVFEVTLSGNVMGAAGGLASKHGASGAFFNGVLATVLATPCTAPFLSLALGFAFAQSAGIIVLIFLTVGAGLAFPYVVLSWYPAWLKFLPKPGAWMEKFKVAMGFPMLATALWLASLATGHYGERSWWLGIFLVFVALAAWVFGQFVQRGSRGKGLAVAIVLLLLATGYLWALDSNLRWRSPIDVSQQASGEIKNAPMDFAWQPWSAEAVAKARAEGRVVLVDFTAKWCITCNSIVKPALEKSALVKKLKEIKAVALVADYTSYPPAITEELARFDRAGVPLVLVYPKNPNASPIVLPDPNPLLGAGHYSGLILDALAKAAE